MAIPITAHLHPEFLDPELLPGSTVVVIDLLRASTTITRALDAGSRAVVPCLEPADAIRLRDSGAHAPCRLGGERHGILIPGFDLGNSPADYTPDTIRARTLLFTTTNGTRAVLRARGILPGAPAHPPADRILIGCLANRAALCEVLAADTRPIRLVCAGTGGDIGFDDGLCAGAIIDTLLGTSPAGRFSLEDDQAQFVLTAYRAVADPALLLAALRSSRGGRNLTALGLDADIADAARADITSTVPELEPAAGAFLSARRSAP